MRCRLAALAAGCLVAVGSVSLPMSVNAADSTDEMNLWFDVSKDACLQAVSSGNSSALTWYVSLQMMQDILNDNDYMIHESQFSDVVCGYGHFFDNENHYQSVIYPTDIDTTLRYDRLLLAHTSVGDIYVSISDTGGSDSDSYLSYNSINGAQLQIGCFFGTSSPPITVEISCDADGYFTNTNDWKHTIYWDHAWSSSYPVNLTFSSRVENVLPTYTPYTTGSYMQFGDIAGGNTQINMSDLGLSDIALTELYTEAGLHDFLVDEWVPGFEAANLGITLSPVPDIEQEETPVYDDQDITLGIPRSWTQTNIRVPSIPTLSLDLPEADFQEVDDTPIAANLTGVMFWWDLLNQILTLSATKALVLTFFILGVVLYVLWNLGR